MDDFGVRSKLDEESGYQTGGEIFLHVLRELGISHLFANFGSDHPAILEALASDQGAAPIPILCPDEMVALSAAHGAALATGRLQAVLVHVDCGTQALGGAVHNAAKGRAPILIFAGLSPFTQGGERSGSRNEFIHWIQDVGDQRSIVRSYTRFDNEIKTAANLAHHVRRARQIAESAPQGPVYLTAAREVLAERAFFRPQMPSKQQPMRHSALGSDDLDEICGLLRNAERPIIVTSFAGRKQDSVLHLVRVAESLGAGVLESVPSAMNFPADNPHHLGSRWNERTRHPELAKADVVLVVESDVPWIPLFDGPPEDAKVIIIDADPLKKRTPLFDFPGDYLFKVSAATALEQIANRLDREIVAGAFCRSTRLLDLHSVRTRSLLRLEEPTVSITAPVLTAAVRDRLSNNSVVLNETISNYGIVHDHLRLNRPGSLFASGGGSLGWNGGAAIGFKLAVPEADVVALTGDGSFLFSHPSTVHWMARRYHTPFLQVIYGNGGWLSPQLSTLALHPQGKFAERPELAGSLFPEPDYCGVAAAAGGAWVERPQAYEELGPALDRAFLAVSRGQSAVVHAALEGSEGR